MAISKPTNLPEWASASANIVEPSEGKKDDGWLTDEIPPSSYENWIQFTNFEWWKWWDEKVTEGATNEDLQIHGSVSILTGPLALTNAYALWGFGKGTYPGIIGTTGDPSLDLTAQEVAIIGLAGTGNTTGAFTDIGVLGSDGVCAVALSNIGTVGYSVTDVGVMGLATAASSVSGATLNDVGVAGIVGACTSVTGGVGVFGFSVWGVHGEGTQQGVRGTGTGSGAEGGVFIGDQGGDGIVGTGASSGAGIEISGGVRGTGGVGTGRGGPGGQLKGGGGATNGEGGIGMICDGGSGAGSGKDGPAMWIKESDEDPASPTNGYLIITSASHPSGIGLIRYYNGTVWKTIATV